MNSSFYNGVSGMKTHQYGIDTLANNIANVNTPGFKASYAEFSDIVANQINSQTNSSGMGSLSSSTVTDFSSGSLLATGSKYDMAIEGKGWFGLTNEKQEVVYTRAGQFSKDAAGFLVDGQGNHLMGTSANNVANGAIVSNPKKSIDINNVTAQSTIHLPDDLTIPAVPTTFINIKGPLDPTRIEEVQLDGSKVEKANVEIYRADLFDTNGNTNKLEITFTKHVPQATTNIDWDAVAVVKDAQDNVISTQNGVLNFNSKGALIGNSLTNIDNNGTPVTIGFGTPLNTAVPNTGYDGVVSLSGVNSSRDIVRDGYPSGILQDYEVDDLGTVQAIFSNGKTIPISRVAVFQFRNEGGMEKLGETHYKPTVNSGEASFFKDQAGNTLQVSNISTKKLEVSNLDISTALTELIVMQKAFDASSKSITTSDQLIQNAINMKR
jgi:flagellar hook protein FlgE